MTDDEELVADALAQIPGAFARLVARHQKLVWHLVYRMVQHPEDARELCQEVFLRVHQRLHQFRFECTLATWIGRIAFSVTTRHLQRKRLPMVEADDDHSVAVIENVPDDFDLDAAYADAELRGHMTRALEALSPIQRTLVTLFHLDELSIPEVVEITQLPEGTVKNYLFRARRRLRDRLIELRGHSA
jgi:RNA polymerase sigma-70 factor (ECF subfamily)